MFVGRINSSYVALLSCKGDRTIYNVRSKRELILQQVELITRNGITVSLLENMKEHIRTPMLEG